MAKEIDLRDRYRLEYRGAGGLSNLTENNRGQIRDEVESGTPLSVESIEPVGTGFNVHVYATGQTSTDAFPGTIPVGPMFYPLEGFTKTEDGELGTLETWWSWATWLVPGTQTGEFSTTTAQAAENTAENVANSPVGEATERAGEAAEDAAEGAGNVLESIGEALSLGAFGKMVLLGTVAALFLGALAWAGNTLGIEAG